MQQKSLVAFLAIDNAFDQEQQIDQIKVDVNKTITSDSKTKLYNLWDYRFVYLSAIKLRKLHKIITLFKLVSIVKDIKNSCEVCALIKLFNKRNYYVNKRKTLILTFVLIDIYELLLASRLRYKYFLEIVDNYFRRT